MADTRITSLNTLLDTTGKMFLAEEYGKVIEKPLCWTTEQLEQQPKVMV